jgi:heparan-alpha-glucosaminide N-acetyltransferase
VKTVPERLACLDAFRGFDILVMVFVNYIAGMSGIPFFLRHATAEMDTFTLTDVVFPGFLFIVGVAIPLSLEKRTALGEPLHLILRRIFSRTAGLLFLGVLFVNENRFSAAATGMSRDLWYFLALVATILLWTVYPKAATRSKKRLYLGLKIAAAILIVGLVILFRGQNADGSISWLRHSWWGILGMIGWTYLAGSLLYLLVRGNRTALLGALGFAVALYIGVRHSTFDFLKTVDNFVLIGSVFGSHTSIVTAGMLVGTLFRPQAAAMTSRKRIGFMTAFGAGLLASGFTLRPLHGFNKIQGTESYCLATAGICCLLLMIVYWLMDVRRVKRWASFLRPVGANPLMAYILPSIIGSVFGFASSLFGTDVSRIFWPYAERGGLPGILNAAVMTGVVLLLTWALTRQKVILKI